MRYMLHPPSLDFTQRVVVHLNTNKEYSFFQWNVVFCKRLSSFMILFVTFCYAGCLSWLFVLVYTNSHNWNFVKSYNVPSQLQYCLSPMSMEVQCAKAKKWYCLSLVSHWRS